MSGKICAFSKCTNNKRKQPELAFFSFPRSKKYGTADRLEQWVKNSGLPPNLPDYVYKTHLVCAKHFERSCFANYLCKRLIQTAVPTISTDDIINREHKALLFKLQPHEEKSKQSDSNINSVKDEMNNSDAIELYCDIKSSIDEPERVENIVDSIKGDNPQETHEEWMSSIKIPTINFRKTYSKVKPFNTISTQENTSICKDRSKMVEESEKSVERENSKIETHKNMTEKNSSAQTYKTFIIAKPNEKQLTRVETFVINELKNIEKMTKSAEIPAVVNLKQKTMKLKTGQPFKVVKINARSIAPSIDLLVNNKSLDVVNKQSSKCVLPNPIPKMEVSAVQNVCEFKESGGSYRMESESLVENNLIQIDYQSETFVCETSCAREQYETIVKDSKEMFPTMFYNSELIAKDEESVEDIELHKAEINSSKLDETSTTLICGADTNAAHASSVEQKTILGFLDTFQNTVDAVPEYVTDPIEITNVIDNDANKIDQQRHTIPKVEDYGIKNSKDRIADLNKKLKYYKTQNSCKSMVIQRLNKKLVRKQNLKAIIRKLPVSEERKTFAKMQLKTNDNWTIREKELSLKIHQRFPVSLKYMREKMGLHLPDEDNLSYWIEEVNNQMCSD